MPAVEIRPGVFWIGVNDRTTDLFEGMWPINREGVTYNSYLIRDRKKVLVDLSKAIKTDEFFSHIQELTAISDLDYIVINHLEPDHTGVLITLLQIARKATILSSAKGAEMLANFYKIRENVRTVADGELLDIGERKLQFFSTPFVHWPETIMTYDTREKILFSCDAFGSYGALRGSLFDDECRDHPFYEKEALRYYVNIVAKFSNPVLKAIEKLAKAAVEVIAPSHGLIWRKDPGRIVALYRQWAEYASGKTPAGVTLLYGSMYGNTERMMNAVAQGISRAGLEPEIFDAARTHPSYILPSLWIRRGVAIGAPTYEGSLFPPMVDALNMAALKRVMGKNYISFGSFGWSGGAMKTIKQIVEPLRWELCGSLEVNGAPAKEDLLACEELGAKLASSILASP